MNQDLEELLASVIESVLVSEEGRVLGLRRRRDGTDGSGVLVDFTYDEVEPPVAMEITTMREDNFLSSCDAADDLARRLTARAELEKLTPFTFVIGERARIRELDNELIDIMRAGVAITVGKYSSIDLAAWKKGGCLGSRLELHRRLQALDVTKAMPTADGEDVVIYTVGSEVTIEPMTGVEKIIMDNLGKLVKAGAGYERHLVIGVADFGISSPDHSRIRVI
jgi:hypothetical protein